VPREEIPAAPEVGAVAEVVAAVPDAVAAPEIAAGPEVVAEQVVDAEYEDGASASNITADVDDLLPPPPAFGVPPMEWLLGGPSAGWLIDDPEIDFSDEEFEVLPPLLYYQRHGSGPCLPSPTPSGEDPAHFAPPGYDPLPEMEEESDVAAAAHVAPTLPDLDLPAAEETEEENEDAPPAPSLALPTPSPEARVLLRRFASAMAARPAGIRRGTWSPEALGLTTRLAELYLNEAAHHSISSSVEGSSRR
jgi:hypothetical protein